MLRNVEVAAVVEVDEGAHVYWGKDVEFSHDCFVCRRAGRTTILEHGRDEGRCVSSQKPRELVGPGIHSFSDVSFTHPSPIRITAFDPSTVRAGGGTRLRLRVRLSFWWAPFEDAKYPGRTTGPLTAGPWVRLSLHVGCRVCFDAGNGEALRTPGHRQIQTNTVWPWQAGCPTCERTLVTAADGPTVTLVD